MSLLSLVVPSHNEAESLPFLFDEINHVTQEMMQEHQDLAGRSHCGRRRINRSHT